MALRRFKRSPPMQLVGSGTAWHKGAGDRELSNALSPDPTAGGLVRYCNCRRPEARARSPGQTFLRSPGHSIILLKLLI
jgi:hypothetical protein